MSCIFYYTKDIDRWGSGLQRIDKECKENNIRYSFEILSSGFLVTFYRHLFGSEKNSEKLWGKFWKKSGKILK